MSGHAKAKKKELGADKRATYVPTYLHRSTKAKIIPHRRLGSTGSEKKNEDRNRNRDKKSQGR